MISCEFEDGGKASLRHVVVDTIVTKGNQILLAKRASHLSSPGKYGLIGGFVDRDETATQAVAREILEETGYSSTVEFLFCIVDNPQRPQEDRQNIAFVYVARAGEKTGEPDNESKEIAWFDLDNLPPKESFAFDHYEDIERYKQHLTNPFSLPFFVSKLPK